WSETHPSALALLRGDDHPGGSHDLVAQAIPALDDLEDRAWLDGVARLREECLVDVRVERPAGGNLHEPLLGGGVAKRILAELAAVDEFRLLVPFRRLERPLEVVEDRQELANEPLVGMRDQSLLLACGPLAVVLEVGLQALQKVEVLVPFGG